MGLQAANGNHRQLVRGVALVGVADVQLAFVLDGVRVAEVGTGIGNAGTVGEDGMADDEDFAEDRLARSLTAMVKGERRPPLSPVVVQTRKRWPVLSVPA